MNKRGITLVSIVLYVVLFFAFTTFAILMSSNINYKIMGEKGMMFIQEQRDKLQVNLLSSAKMSEWIQKDNQKVVFSNNDIYEFNAETKVITKNGGVLIRNVEECNFNLGISDISLNNNIDVTKISKDVLAIKVKLLKYGQEKECEYVFYVGDETYEEK